MNDKDKINCNDDLITKLSNSSRWRLTRHDAYPRDTRNLPAAGMLAKLATDMVLSDDEWTSLQPHFLSDAWPKAVSKAARDVGFTRYPRTSPAFIRNLICVLNDSVACS